MRSVMRTEVGADKGRAALEIHTDSPLRDDRLAHLGP
jgi:hypothetical protein